MLPVRKASGHSGKMRIFGSSLKKRANMDKVKIAVVGLGGVGGFLGGKLARHYAGSDRVEVNFIARGQTLENVRRDGLVVEAREGTFTARPHAVTDRAEELGVMDYVIYATKSYDIEGGVESIRGCVGERTVVIPFLNGVDGTERIRKLLPCNEVWDGCVFIVARIAAPGRILETTEKYLYLYGSKTGTAQRLAEADRIFAEAGLNARSFPDIERRVWNKFAFISTLATITSYTDKTYGEILSDPADLQRLNALFAEFGAVARAKGAEVARDIPAEVLGRVKIVPPDSTTSMQRDFRAGKTTELESLTGYIVREGERLGVPTPVYRQMYEALRNR